MWEYDGRGCSSDGYDGRKADSLDLVVMLACLNSLDKSCLHLCFSLTTGKW